MSEPDPIVEALRERRLALHLTHGDVAKLRGLARDGSSVRNSESGRYSPTLATLRRWADVLGCDLVLVRRDTVAPLEVIAERRRVLLGESRLDHRTEETA